MFKFIICILSIVLVSCETSKKVTTESVEQRVSTEVVSNSEKSNYFSSDIFRRTQDTTSTEVDILHIEYDNTVTDSDGTHPVKAVTAAKVKRQAKRNETVQDTTTVTTHDTKVVSNTENSESAIYNNVSKTRVSKRLIFAVFVTLAALVTLILYKYLQSRNK